MISSREGQVRVDAKDAITRLLPEEKARFERETYNVRVTHARGMIRVFRFKRAYRCTGNQGFL